MLQRAVPSVDRLFRALSDRTRLRALYLLLKGDICVGEFVAVLRLPQPTVSHLAYLRRAGLVTVRRDVSRMYYALVGPRTPFQAKVLGCVSSCVSEEPELIRDATRARERVSSS